MSVTTSYAASDKQMAFIKRLWAEREHEPGDVPSLLTKQAASLLISTLLTKPRVHTEPDEPFEPVTEPGMYLRDKRVYKVKASRSSGRLYASQLTLNWDCEGHESLDGAHMGEVVYCDGSCRTGEVHSAFVYAPGAVLALRPEHKMSLEQASKFGLAFGVCCVCGALLTDPKSVADGIGPICAKRF